MNGLYIIPILAILIILHECGHFFAARSVGVKVEEFGIGIPPRVKGWRWKGVLWSLNALPLGGFVRVLGEDGKSMEPGSMNTKGPWQRAFFLAAGSGMNLITAVVLMIALIGIQGDPVDYVYINYVEPGSPAAAAGWQAGDRIVSAGGSEIESKDELRSITNDFFGRPMAVTVERGGQLIETTVEPRANPPEGQGATGIRLVDPDPIKATITVEEVLPGTAAAAAGLQAGDRFVSIDGNPIEDQYDYIHQVNQSQGRTVPIVVERDGEEITLTWEVPVGGLTVRDVEFGSPAGEAGWQSGDRILAINGQTVNDGGATLIDTIRAASGQPFTVTVDRDGQTIESTLTMPGVTPETPFDDVVSNLGVNLEAATTTELTGINADVSPEFESVPFSQIIPRGFQEAYTTTVTMIDGIRELVTSTDQWDQIAGPIGMGQITNEALEASPLPTWVTLTRIAIVLSLNLALLNLLPLPALDGGRLLFVAIEILRGGRRIAPEKEGLVHLVGFLVLIGFMFVIAFYDVDRILDGRSFIP